MFLPTFNTYNVDPVQCTESNVSFLQGFGEKCLCNGSVQAVKGSLWNHIDAKMLYLHAVVNVVALLSVNKKRKHQKQKLC